MIPGDYPNLLIDCIKCRKIFSEIDSVYRKITESYSSSYEGKKVSVSFELIYDGALEKILAKQGWCSLLNGGFVCPKCRKELIKNSDDFSNEISNSIKGFLGNPEKNEK